MKYLIILVLVLLIVWQWRNGRVKDVKAKSERDTTPKDPVDMVACAHCGVHLPAQDAIQGKAGPYCGAQHRATAEH